MLKVLVLAAGITEIYASQRIILESEGVSISRTHEITKDMITKL